MNTLQINVRRTEDEDFDYEDIAEMVKDPIESIKGDIGEPNEQAQSHTVNLHVRNSRKTLPSKHDHLVPRGKYESDYTVLGSRDIDYLVPRSKGDVYPEPRGKQGGGSRRRRKKAKQLQG